MASAEMYPEIEELEQKVSSLYDELREDGKTSQSIWESFKATLFKRLS